MRLISLLAALLIIGLLVFKQIAPDAPSEDPLQAGETTQLPKVPTKPGDVKQFETQMDSYLQEQAKKRKEEIERIESQ